MSSSTCHLGRFLLVFALLLSGRTHWFVLQSIAWTAMIVTRATETSLVDAVKGTFDGAHPCGLCQKIGEGRAKEQRQGAPVIAGKIELFHERVPVIVHPYAPESWLPTISIAAQSRVQPPGLPPPRLG